MLGYAKRAQRKCLPRHWIGASRARIPALIDRIDPIRGDIAELRHAIDAKLEQAFEKHLKPVEKRLDELTEKVHSVDKRIETVKGDLIAWSFVFWVGAVGAIAVLAGVLK